jgi:pimeloyl-ACP methyl ester carboxylesterase
MCGTEDEVTPTKEGSYLADKIEVSKLIAVDGGIHLAFSEKPQAVKQFVDSLQSRCLSAAGLPRESWRVTCAKRLLTSP